MRASPRFVASLVGWWKRFRQKLLDYEQRNLAEWQHWGTRRAQRELGQRLEAPESRKNG